MREGLLILWCRIDNVDRFYSIQIFKVELTMWSDFTQSNFLNSNWQCGAILFNPIFERWASGVDSEGWKSGAARLNGCTVRNEDEAEEKWNS